MHEVYSLDIYKRRGVKVDISEVCDVPYHRDEYVNVTSMNGHCCVRCMVLVYKHPSTGGRWWGIADANNYPDTAA